jgi:hypothetical protein
MNYTYRLIKLADRFETKLKKYAGEADSSAISIFIVGTISKSMEAFNLQNRLATALTAKRDAEWRKGNEIYGDVTIGGGGSMTAHKEKSGWVIDSISLNVTGSLVDNPAMKPVIDRVYNSYIPRLKDAVKAALDSYSRDPNWANYTTISNYEMPYDSPKVWVEL